MDIDMDLLAMALLAVIGTAVAPFLVAILVGVDRKVTARMQNRVGPPITQPLWDLAKLLTKHRMVVNKGQLMLASLYVAMALLALWMFLAGGDLLIIFFVLSAAAVFYTLAGYAVLSPYSQIGATRELVQIMAYEPVVLIVFFGFFLVNGSFSSAPTAEPTIVQLPLMFPAMLLVLLVKLQKSPYDVAEAHTEIVSGPEVEYSGPYLGLVKYGHWVEAAVFFGIVSLLWGHPVLWVSVVGKVALVLLALFLVILIDNSSARLRFGQMARTVLPVGLALTALNAFVVWAVQEGVIPWP